MDAPTAAQILRSLDRHRVQAQFASLADLDDAGHDAVRRALSAVPAGSRIDVDILIASVRADVVRRAEAEAAKRAEVNPLGILKYRLSLMSKGELGAMRDELRAKVDAGEGDQPFEPGTPGALLMDRLGGIAARLHAHTADVEPDDVEDEDKPRPPRRRGGVPRLRPQGVQGYVDAPTEATPPAGARTRSRAE